MSAAINHGGLFPRPHAGLGHLDPEELVHAPASLGLSLLSHLDALGGRVADRYAAHRAAIPTSSRIHPATAVVASGVALIGGLFVWGAVSAGAGANQWVTAPGAGNAEAAAAGGGHTGAEATAALPAASKKAAQVTVHEDLVIVTGGMTGHKGWPEYVDSKKIDLPAHAKVVLTITSFDDGPAPLAKNLRIYDKVQGTKGGTETYDGKSVSSVPNQDVAHTFTVPGIGLNLPVPAAKDAKNGQVIPAEVTATFTTDKTGSFTWQCYAPCGSGKNGMSGAMSTPGYMTGKVVIG